MPVRHAVLSCSVPSLTVLFSTGGGAHPSATKVSTHSRAHPPFPVEHLTGAHSGRIATAKDDRVAPLWFLYLALRSLEIHLLITYAVYNLVPSDRATTPFGCTSRLLPVS
jgi:hypothetical protein